MATIDTHDHNRALAHHFEHPAQQREAVNLGMWAFLVTEIMFFGGLIVGYVVYRLKFPMAFTEGSSHLDVTLGAVNTAVLIGSGFMMALAVNAAQNGERKLLITFLVLTILLGCVFLGIKVVEYGDKFEHHLVPIRGTFQLDHVRYEGVDPAKVQLFFGFYFAMTGMHAIHMIIGIGVLLILVVDAWRGIYSAEYNTPVNITGLYWHFVDIVWIFLFPMLYLIGRHLGY